MQENPRINRQDRQKITFPGSAYSLPQGDLPAVHSRYTQNQCTVRLSSWGLPSLSLTTKGSWIHLVGRVAKPLVSPLTPSPPPHWSPVSGTTFLQIFSFLCLSLLDLGSVTGQTDRRTDDGHQCLMQWRRGILMASCQKSHMSQQSWPSSTSNNISHNHEPTNTVQTDISIISVSALQLHKK